MQSASAYRCFPSPGIGEEPAAREFALFHLAQFCLQLEIGCICFGASALARRGNVGAGLGLAALLYFLNLIGNISEAAEFLHYITPFHYAEAADILGDRALNVPLLLLGLGYAAAGICLAFARYTKRILQRSSVFHQRSEAPPVEALRALSYFFFFPRFR